MANGKLLGGAIASALLIAAGPVLAQSPEEFYRGKTVTFLVGSGAGGSYGLYARLINEFMPKYIPGNPSIVVRFTGGQSGGLDVANLMHNTVQPDGLTMAMTQQTIVMHQVLQPQYAKYDAREWYWLGNMSPIRNMLLVWHTAKAQSVEQAKHVEVVIGATGPSSPTSIVPRMLNKLAGTKFKLVMGYKGVADLDLAMRRGEIEGRGASWVSAQTGLANEIAEKKVRAIVFASRTREPTAPDVPTLAEVMPNEDGKRVANFLAAESDFGRSVFLPPRTPADRAATLRKAFEAAMKDNGLLAMAAKMKISIEPISGDALAAITREVVATPKEILELAK